MKCGSVISRVTQNSSCRVFSTLPTNTRYATCSIDDHHKSGISSRTRCLYHDRPVRPSLSVKALSAIINLSFSSLTFISYPFPTKSHPLFSSITCKISSRAYVCSTIPSAVPNPYLLLLDINLFSSFPELPNGLDQRTKVHLFTRDHFLQLFHTFLYFIKALCIMFGNNCSRNYSHPS